MPSSSFAPQYWEKNSMPPPTKPQYPLNIREENWAHSPTAPTCVWPREAIIMVSTMEPVVVRRFCSATGTAITAIFFRNFSRDNAGFSCQGVFNLRTTVVGVSGLRQMFDRCNHRCR